MQAVVVTFDHLAVAALGCYGNPSGQTPQFDRLAAGSVVFDQCFATVDPVEPIPGLADVVDRLHHSGGTASVSAFSLDSQANQALTKSVGEWQAASAAGRKAFLWLKSREIASPWTVTGSRFVASWQRMLDADALPATLAAVLPDNTIRSLLQTTSLESAIEETLPRLRELGVLNRDRVATSPEIGRLRRTIYAAAVGQLDDRLGELLRLLGIERLHETLLIVTAEGGDLAGPHPELATGCPPLIDPLLHAPLFARTGTPADGTRRGALVSTADIAPTLEEWFELDRRPADNCAHSLSPLLRDEQHALRDELLIGRPQTGWRLQTTEFACVCGQKALQSEEGELPTTSPDRPRLFIKPDDAREMLDVAREHPDVTDDMVQRIRELARSTAGAGI